MLKRLAGPAAAEPSADLDDYPVALLRLDAAGRVAACNAAWVALMEAPSATAALSDYVHPEDRALWEQALAELRQRPDVCFRQRLRFVHPSGEQRWFDLALQRRGAAFFLSLTDGTRHQRRETSLQAGQRSALNLLDGLPGLIYRGRNNRAWTMEFISAGCLALTGYPAERFMNSHQHTYSQLILPADADYVWHGAQHALQRRAAYELSYRICCADGQVKHVWEKGAGIYSSSGEVLGIEGAIFERLSSA